MMGLDMWSGAATLGLDGLLFLADVGLAAGAKMEIRLLILIWLFVFGFHIVISVLVPPVLIIVGWLFDEYFKKAIHGPNFYVIILGYIANTASFDHSKLLFFIYHGIAFALGLFYIYIWLVARSLFKEISPSSTVHVLRGYYRDDNKDQQNSRF